MKVDEEVVVMEVIVVIDVFVDDLSPIKQQGNTELKTRQQKRKRRRSTTGKQLKLNHQ